MTVENSLEEKLDKLLETNFTMDEDNEGMKNKLEEVAKNTEKFKSICCRMDESWKKAEKKEGN